ncbi:sec-independent protein translocase protein TatA [Balneicella halophila]|uniref:Sec-independent protein translocase protein TatA n=1 Tax=Balneicella halophila TaxID=1537566 RepID=A0A7L4UNV4_BALHA|nr:twin-arginine translocase TatA/TatE family subunit [Balneicella halophila]PVX50805.1 sec-independent protein translocase protein TatA [Balneicella halophila]
MLLNTIFLGMFGHWEILIIILVVVIIFGGKKIPELFKGVGEGMREFKKATKEEEEDSHEKK